MKLLEVTLTARDLEEMRRFYAAVLGLREIEPHWTDRLVLQVGGTRLVFIHGPAEWTGRYHFAFNVPTDAFEQAQVWLGERGGALASPEGQTVFHSDSWNADMVYFADPQGNILELIARQGKETGAAQGRAFNASDILSVSEIGISADSVADSVASLTTRMPGLAVYSGAGSSDFTAVGDPDGLFIIVHTGRIWYPNTGVPALPLPLEVLAEMQDEGGLRRRYRLSAPPFPFTIQPES